MLRLVIALLVASAATSAAQTGSPSEPPLPPTGLDFTAIDAFWPVVDLLRKEMEPSEAQWKALRTTPGYRLARIALGDVLDEDLELAFRPSRRTAYDSLTKLQNDRASRLTHLVRAASLRPQLDAFRDSLTRTAPIAEAVRTAATFLPPGATNTGDPPLVAFAIFRNDGYSLGPGVVVDLLNAYEANLVLFLGHEFHHTYVGRAQEAALGLAVRPQPALVPGRYSGRTATRTALTSRGRFTSASGSTRCTRQSRTQQRSCARMHRPSGRAEIQHRLRRRPGG